MQDQKMLGRLRVTSKHRFDNRPCSTDSNGVARALKKHFYSLAE